MFKIKVHSYLNLFENRLSYLCSLCRLKYEIVDYFSFNSRFNSIRLLSFAMLNIIYWFDYFIITSFWKMETYQRTIQLLLNDLPFNLIYTQYVALFSLYLTISAVFLSIIPLFFPDNFVTLESSFDVLLFVPSRYFVFMSCKEAVIHDNQQ